MAGGDEDQSVDRTRILVERKIRELVEQGYFDNLPGEGQPLDLSDEDNPFVPADMRLGYRILRNAGVTLPWIELGNEVESDAAELRRRAEAHGQRLRTSLDRLRLAIPAMRERRLASLEKEHAEFVASYLKAAADLNRKIELFNISVPVGNLQKPYFQAEPTLEALDSMLRAW